MYWRSMLTALLTCALPATAAADGQIGVALLPYSITAVILEGQPAATR